MFDKESGQVSLPHIKNVAQEKWFYGIPEAICRLDDGISRQAWEDSFNDFEDEASKKYEEIINAALDPAKQTDLTNILADRTSKSKLAILMLMQLLRTRAARDYIWTEGMELTAQHAWPGLAEYGGTIENYKEFLSSKPIRFLQHFDWLWQGIAILAPIISAMEWKIGIAPPQLPLLTSDAPVIRTDVGFRKVIAFQGLMQPEAEIAYPLSPRVALILKGQNVHAVHKSTEVITDLDQKDVKNLNAGQVWQSHRQVYGSTDESVFCATLDAIGKKLNELDSNGLGVNRNVIVKVNIPSIKK